jgi:hypothetical protein
VLSADSFLNRAIAEIPGLRPRMGLAAGTVPMVGGGLGPRTLSILPGTPIGLRVGAPGLRLGTDSKSSATGCSVAEVEANLALDRR